jgi:competence protein ComEC
LATSRVSAFAVGLVLGIGAGAGISGGVVFSVPEKTVQGITGTLLEDPRIVSGGRAMATLSLKMTMSGGGVRATARGEIPVFFPEESAVRLQEFGRGADVAADGYLRVTEGGFYGPYSFIADSLHITKPAPPLERFRTGLRLGLIRRFSRADNNGVPWSGLSLALLLGVRDNLDSGFAASYRSAGCSFILALSGMHLAVLAALISFLLKKPFGLRPAAIAGGLIIIAYCLLVGPLPSLYRAALMYILGVIAVLGMLKKEPLSLLCTAFIIQLVVTPQAGKSLSFILSYSALAGILIIGGMINRIFKGKIPDFFLLSISASLGAFIATAGISAFVFSTLRPVGLIAGLILAPLTMMFMICSIAWLFLDLISPVVSSVLHWPLALLYTLQDKTSSLAGYVPGFEANPHLILWLSVALTALMAWFDFRRKATGNRLEPFE